MAKVHTRLPRIIPFLNNAKRLSQRFFLHHLWIGDPLSPFLFTLVADALSQILRQGEKQHLFKALQLEKEGIPISHLQYVDDMLLFLDGDR